MLIKYINAGGGSSCNCIETLGSCQLVYTWTNGIVKATEPGRLQRPYQSSLFITDSVLVYPVWVSEIIQEHIYKSPFSFDQIGNNMEEETRWRQLDKY